MRRLRLLPLVAATYFMVSGGPYGLEDIVGQAGYARAWLLLELDIMLYGLALVLEFVALVVLRWREPDLARPFRIPGGLWMAACIGAAPTLLIFFTIYAARADRMTPRMPAILFGGVVVVAGLLLYGCKVRRK